MKLSRLLPVGLFGVLVIFLAIGLTRDPSVIPTEMIDREMPDFELPELRDETAMVSQADLVGQVTLVNVFGSWCVACLQEHPTLMQLSQSETVRIVGINWRDDREDALAWLASFRAGRGQPLKAGQFVTLGSIVKTEWIEAGDEVVTEIDGLGTATLILE